jgi:hypothetical protein
MSYSFRHRFRIGPRVRIQSEEAHLQLSDPDSDQEDVRVRSRGRDQALKDAEHLVLIGSSYATREDASGAGLRWRWVLQKAFAATCIGADFGDRALGGGLTEAGRKWMEQITKARVLSDDHSLMIFESSPPPTFVSWGGTGRVGKNAERLMAG